MKRIILFTFILLSCSISFSQSKKLNVIVDERMELITIAQYLSGYFVLTQADINYKKEIDNYFNDYKSHEAIKLLDELQNDFFNFDKVPMVMYHYSFPKFKQTHEFPVEYQSKINKTQKEKIEVFLGHLKDFYQISNFKTFFKQHKTFYAQMVDSVTLETNKYNLIETMEAHYGIKQKSYTIVLTPLLHEGGFGTKTKDNNGFNIYGIIGPSNKSIDQPYFNSDKIIKEQIIHEFSHSFSNPLIHKFYDELKEDSCLLNSIRERMEKQAYGTWKSVLYEHLVRANEIILNKKLFGADVGAQVFKYHTQERGFTYLKDLVPLIEKYSSNQDKYGNLEGFMPMIIKYFHDETRNCQ